MGGVETPEVAEMAEMGRAAADRAHAPYSGFQVGAVIVTDKNTQVLAIGYNGNYAGGPNEVESTTPGASGMIHAEINAMIKLDYNNPNRKIMYVTLSPCRDCAKAIVNGGISEVVYCEEYRNTSGLELLREVGITVRQYVPEA